MHFNGSTEEIWQNVIKRTEVFGDHFTRAWNNNANNMNPKPPIIRTSVCKIR